MTSVLPSLRNSKYIKTLRVGGLGALKLIFLLGFLYFFICSLSFLSDSFRVLGGKNIGGLFTKSELLQNPIVGVMIGVLVTVLVQSSSTSTSIIVGLVSAGAAPVSTAIPMIMGSNIGTSVTNTIVSFSQVGNRDEFRRAFACATVHDMFNWLTVIVLLIIEVISGFLEYITSKMVDQIASSKGNSSSLAGETSSPDFLKKLTGPFTKSIIQLDKHVLEAWAANDPEYENVTTILKLNCKGENETMLERCPYLFAFLGPQGSDIGDKYMGILLLALALGMLSGCLLGMVKSLNALLGSRVKGFIERTINTDIPIRGLGWLTGYMYMFVGAVITVLVQSSSVFTSTLTPLAGAGLISLERAYPLTLGSNIGTTTTSLLASIAAGGENVADAIQIALVHLMFNIIGILLFYPIPVMRWPISLARILGDSTAQYRWISLVYLIGMFFLFPVIIFAISLAGPLAMYIILLPIAIIIILAIIINLVQNHKPSILPGFLKNWDFLPLFLHSLEPYDKIITRLCGWCRCCKPTTSPTSPTGADEEENKEKEGNEGQEKEGSEGQEKEGREGQEKEEKLRQEKEEKKRQEKEEKRQEKEEGKIEKETSISLKKMTKDNKGFENNEVV